MHSAHVVIKPLKIFHMCFPVRKDKTCPDPALLRKFDNPLRYKSLNKLFIYQILDFIAYQKKCIITLKTSFVLQSQIGWDMVLRGFVTTKWEAVGWKL